MIAGLTFCIWLYLILAHGKFWLSSPELPAAVPQQCPDVDIVVAARDEAETIGAAIVSLLGQDYRGKFRLVLVDDNSSDGTAALAGVDSKLCVIRLESKPAGWSGKLWALRHGVAAGNAPMVLLADADIVHDARHVSSLVAHMLGTEVDMVSEMVRLNCTSFAERALVPAFVYFFQMLYPFSRVNDPRSSVAAAAGGTVLIRRQALQRIGGFDAIKNSMIDDVALARAVKRGGAVYLGHGALAHSIRRYPRFADLWNLISRTAFTQLRHSPMLLAMTLGGLALIWLAPLAEVLLGHGLGFGFGLAAFTLAAATYLPTLARYGRNPLWSLALPLIALFYMAATLGSAVDHWRGKGVNWKSRAYGAGA